MWRAGILRCGPSGDSMRAAGGGHEPVSGSGSGCQRDRRPCAGSVAESCSTAPCAARAPAALLGPWRHAWRAGADHIRHHSPAPALLLRAALEHRRGHIRGGGAARARRRPALLRRLGEQAAPLPLSVRRHLQGLRAGHLRAQARGDRLCPRDAPHCLLHRGQVHVEAASAPGDGAVRRLARASRSGKARWP